MNLSYVINFVLAVFVIFLTFGHFKILNKLAQYEESFKTHRLLARKVDIMNSYGNGVVSISANEEGNGTITLNTNGRDKSLMLLTGSVGSFVISDVHATLSADGKVNAIHESAIKELGAAEEGVSDDLPKEGSANE